MRLGWVLVAFIVALLPLQGAIADTRLNSRFLSVYGPASAPLGYRMFCERHPADCRLARGEGRMVMTPERWADLEQINLIANRTVEPVSDEELYGRVEVWTYPGLKGDCEDYVLLKRQMLMERGWSAASVLITVVLDEDGIGHAVLTARTTKGDFVLDNRSKNVVPWHAVPYDFIKRQSAVNPNFWVSLTPQAIREFASLGRNATRK